MTLPENARICRRQRPLRQPDLPLRGTGAALAREPAQRRSMTNFSELPVMPSGTVVPPVDPLRLAVAAYLARFKGSSRDHTDSDLRCYLSWCAGRDLDPLAARRPHLELYIRWMQEVRRFRPSTVPRRFSVAAGFYRTCVIDGVLEHSPAEYVHRPTVPAESPAPGSRTCSRGAARRGPPSANSCGFALVAMLGLLGLRIFEATGADVETPTLAPPCDTTAPARTSTATPTTSSPPTWPPERKASTSPMPRSVRSAGRRWLSIRCLGCCLPQRVLRPCGVGSGNVAVDGGSPAEPNAGSVAGRAQTSRDRSSPSCSATCQLP